MDFTVEHVKRHIFLWLKFCYLINLIASAYFDRQIRLPVYNWVYCPSSLILWGFLNPKTMWFWDLIFCCLEFSKISSFWEHENSEDGWFLWIPKLKMLRCCWVRLFQKIFSICWLLDKWSFISENCAHRRNLSKKVTAHSCWQGNLK